MQLRLHNTATRTKEVFEPADPKRVRMYVCGPTVYQRIHVGNARPLIVFDVLFRLLRHRYGEKHVTYVRNITDVEDKIIAQAAANGESIQGLTERTARQFHEDAAALGCLPPTHEPRATEHVPGMVALIAELIRKGHAYAAEGHVLFHVPSMPTYGRLSGRDRADQVAGARVEIAPYKRDPADFVLWKPSEPDQPGWDSPWGRGRPGWHIECSAMSEALLGPLPFDIHGGGIDLIFPHHENEIAQSCCASGVEPMARFWLHNGFVDMRGEKMSKSLGNVVQVGDELKVFPGEAIRLNLLTTHYRKPLEYGEDVQRSYRWLDRTHDLLEAHSDIEANNSLPSDRVVEALCDDLNTPKTLFELQRLMVALHNASSPSEKREAKGRLLASAYLLGLLDDEPEWRRHKVDKHNQTIDGICIEAKIAERQSARRARDFARADAIRAELAKRGILLEDGPSGTTWRRA